MLIAHLADVHLGYRAYSRVTSHGINRREADVFAAFEAVLGEVAGCDLVIIAGDLFHSVRPSNLSIYHTYRLLAGFRQRSDAPVVIIGGNHDTPKSVESGCILDLLGVIPGVYVQHRRFSVVRLEQIDTAVYCLPYFGMMEKDNADIRPHDGLKHNVLAAHGAVEGVMKTSCDPEDMRLRPSELNFGEWTYVAFGHYHIHKVFESNACYCGALEYTSTNIWEECPEAAGSPPPKGYATYDTDTREIRHHPTPRLRTVRLLGQIDGEALSAAELMEKIERSCECLESIDGCIGRVVIEGFPRELQRELDWTRIRDLKNSALFLDVTFRPVQRQTSERSISDSPDAQQRGSLLERWTNFATDLEDLPKGVDRERLQLLGAEYLGKATSDEVAA